MGLKVVLCSTAYPVREQALSRIGIDVTDSIDGFMKAKSKNERFPFLGVYQNMVDSYFYFKKFDKLDFVFITGGGVIMPRTIANKILVYVHYITDYPIHREIVSQQDYLKSSMQKIYRKPWSFISNNLDMSYKLDYIKKATIITNSNYTKNVIRAAWGIDSTVIYPPCPQYSFPLDIQEKREDIVCSMGRFTPEKNYGMIIKIAHRLPNIRFELVGSVAQDKVAYLDKLIKTASKNITFHVNATVQEKIDVLKKSKVLLHSFIGEPFGIALVEAMSAGVIPVTHNSGAAKIDGIVPQEFRYDNLDSAITSVTNAISSWDAQRALRFREFAKSFSPESFRENLKAFIANWFKSI
jgi:glycosyltransferase involved in cell wall biosynthesis